MMRVLLLALAGACTMGLLPVAAEQLCVSCEGPAASYSCAVEQPPGKRTLGSTIEAEICTKVMASKGPHSKCQVVSVGDGAKCAGPERTVSVTDYQRAIGDSEESTYEVGALEIARRNVHNTWLCVASMFKDC
jgi:hypothetical protein